MKNVIQGMLVGLLISSVIIGGLKIYSHFLDQKHQLESFSRTAEFESGIYLKLKNIFENKGFRRTMPVRAEQHFKYRENNSDVVFYDFEVYFFNQEQIELKLYKYFVDDSSSDFVDLDTLTKIQNYKRKMIKILLSSEVKNEEINKIIANKDEISKLIDESSHVEKFKYGY